MNEKVGIIHSIRTKLCVMVAAAVFLTGMLMVLLYSPRVKNEIGNMAQHYLYDLAVSYGTMVNDRVESDGVDKGLSGESLAECLEGVGLQEIESSYVYVVSADGMMLYHPTPEKIGEPVENEVVKGVTEDIQAGKKVKNEVVRYIFKGVTKYAAVYVNDNADFILVVTTDEEELFAPVNAINRIGFLGMLFTFIVFTVFGSVFVLIYVIKPLREIQRQTIKVSKMDFRENEERRCMEKRPQM